MDINGADSLSLRRLLKEFVPEAMAIILGSVISVSPLKIQVIGDEKLVLNKNVVYVPKHLTNYQTTVDISLGSGTINSITQENQGLHDHGPSGGHPQDIGDGVHSHTNEGEHQHNLHTFSITGASMTVYNGLKANDILYILSFNHGKKYYILDRVEAIS